ncbi:MAG: hypothetical protein K6C33_04330 [Desulfovibrio sp.]|nr:hypothetical protein [Desulfovibrio sp.]
MKLTEGTGCPGASGSRGAGRHMGRDGCARRLGACGAGRSPAAGLRPADGPRAAFLLGVHIRLERFGY